MKTGTLEKKIAKLPESLKIRAEGYIDALLEEANGDEGANPTVSIIINKQIANPRPVFGSGKGIFGKMADDFDEPLDDFKEYR